MSHVVSSFGMGKMKNKITHFLHTQIILALKWLFPFTVWRRVKILHRPAVGSRRCLHMGKRVHRVEIDDTTSDDCWRLGIPAPLLRRVSILLSLMSRKRQNLYRRKSLTQEKPSAILILYEGTLKLIKCHSVFHFVNRYLSNECYQHLLTELDEKLIRFYSNPALFFSLHVQNSAISWAGLVPRSASWHGRFVLATWLVKSQVPLWGRGPGIWAWSIRIQLTPMAETPAAPLLQRCRQLKSSCGSYHMYLCNYDYGAAALVHARWVAGDWGLVNMMQRRVKSVIDNWKSQIFIIIPNHGCDCCCGRQKWKKNYM